MIRFNPERHSFDMEQMAERYRSDDLPIPKVIEVGEVDGGFFAISERVFGEFLEELSPESMRIAAPAVLRGLDAMRKADTSDSGGFGPWNPTGDGHYATWSECLIAGIENEVPGRSRADWGEALEASVLAARAFAVGMGVVKSLAPNLPHLRNVVHSDLMNRNVLVAGDRVVAVFDWQCVLYGDFLYDLAWLTFWAPWHPGVQGADFRGLALDHFRELDLDVPDFDDRMRCYEAHIGVRHLVYNAWRRNVANLEATARRTLEVIG